MHLHYLCGVKVLQFMRKAIGVLALLMATGIARAQTDGVYQAIPSDTVTSTAPTEGTLLPENSVRHAMAVSRQDIVGVLEDVPDSLRLPVVNAYGQALFRHPYGWSDLGLWRLHSGLNLNVGASVWGAWGGGLSCLGFSQNISLLYALPLSKRLSMALGGYLSNTFMTRGSYRDAGLSAMLNYRLNEHWEAYVYAQKSLVTSRAPLPVYGMGRVGDRIGAALKYNFNPAFSVQLNVEYGEAPAPWVRGRSLRR